MMTLVAESADGAAASPPIRRDTVCAMSMADAYLTGTIEASLGGALSRASISRAMSSLVTPQHFDLVQRFKRLYAHYQRNHDLISVGAYVQGSDPLLDEAIVLYPRMEHFLKQGMFEAETYATSLSKLSDLFGASGSSRAEARSAAHAIASNS